MKVKIKNYEAFNEYEGQIGKVIDEHTEENYYTVKIESGEEILPYKPTHHPSECEIVEEVLDSWYVVVTTENLKELSEWRFGLNGCSLNVGQITRRVHGSKEHNPINSTELFGKEITMEKFRKITGSKYKWAIKPKTVEEGITVREWINANGKRQYENEPGEEMTYYWHFPNYECTYDRNQYCSTELQKGYTEIDFTEFKKLTSVEISEFILPEKWFCVATSQEECKILISWFNKKFHTILCKTFYGWDWIASDGNYSTISQSKEKNFPKDYEQITFQQFEEYILKIKKMNITYKIKDKKYIDAVHKLIISSYATEYKGDNLTSNGNNKSVETLENLGLLDLWFEEVKIPVFEKGDFVTDDDGKNIYEYDRCENGSHFTKCDGEALEANLRKATEEEISTFSLRISGYTPVKEELGIAYGCQLIPFDTLIALGYLLSRSSFSTTIKVNDKEITTEFIDKLLNL